MSTLPGRPHTAVLVIDVQNGVMEGAHERDKVITAIAGVVDHARSVDVPVVWIQHSSDDLPTGSPQWEYVTELQPLASEPLVHKRYGDSFEDTDLEAVLAGLGVGKVVVTGAQTDACIRSTLHGAFVRGYDTLLVSDAHTTEDLTQWGAPQPGAVIAHTNLYWGFQSAPGREAGTLTADEVSFA